MKDLIYPFLLVSQLQVAEAVEHNSGFFGFLPDWLDTLLSMIALVMVPVIVVVVFVAMGGKTFRLIWYVISLQPLRRWLTRKRLQDQECPSDDTDHLQKVFFMGESRFRKILRFPV